MNIADRLRLRLCEALAGNAETLRSIAERIDVPFTTVADWAKGRSVPPLDRADRLARAIGLSLKLERRSFTKKRVLIVSKKKNPARDIEFERAAKKLGLKPEDGPFGRELVIGLASVMQPMKENRVKKKTKSCRQLKPVPRNPNDSVASRKTRKTDLV